MKEFTVVLFFLILCFCKLNAQSIKDSIAIKETSLNYIEGYFYKDVDRFSKAVHPELVKRTIRKDKSGNNYIINLGASFMGMATANNLNKNLLGQGSGIKSEIIIFDIFENIASVKITNNQYPFIDYLHLVKFNGEWKIINVLWENYPDQE